MASIAIYAPKSIVYVAGTVNDIDTVFHRNQDDGKWYGYAAVVDGGKYHLKIEMYDNAGNHSMYENTLYCDLPVFIQDGRRSRPAHIESISECGGSKQD